MQGNNIYNIHQYIYNNTYIHIYGTLQKEKACIEELVRKPKTKGYIYIYI